MSSKRDVGEVLRDINEYRMTLGEKNPIRLLVPPFVKISFIE